MIQNISVGNFKCFRDLRKFPLSQINILYGKNGRGKSTLAQALLLLAQTMQRQNEVDALHLVGRLIELGTFADVLNSEASQNEIFLDVCTEEETVEMKFSEYCDKPQMAELTGLVVNGIDRFDVSTDESGSAEGEKQAGVTSDVIILQNLKSLQYVSADRKGPRNYSIRRDSLDAEWQGADGEFVINVLSNLGETFRERVCQVLSEVLSGASLNVTSVADRVELFLNSVDNNGTYTPKNVGFGYSYVLPVIVAALLAKPDSVLVIENPEAHLHPGAQSRLMKFLIEEAKKKNIQLIIESHSDHVVNGLRIAMKQNFCGLRPEDASVVFFEHDVDNVEPEVKIIMCDRNGELSDYPSDFMDEWTNQLVKLI